MKDRKFVNKITNNLGLKLLAFVIACALWLVVVNYDDPMTSYTYSGIPVEIINADALLAKGKVYEVLDGTDTVSVTIYGKRSVVESIGKENIKAVADMENLTLMNTVEITVSTNKNYNKLDSIKTDTPVMQLAIENLLELNYPVSVNVNGTVADGYVLGEVSLNQNTIKVSGPESIVSTVKSAKLSIDVTDRTTDMYTSVDVFLYDGDGNVVDKSKLNLNVNSINVTATVLPIKAVDILYAYSGEPVEGYAVNGNPTGDKTAVYIAGKANVIESITSIVVPPTAISVEGKDDDYTTVIDLNNYLPDGIRFSDASFDGKVSVTVDIEPTEDKTVNVPLSNIAISGVPTGYTAEIYVSSDNVSDDDEDINISDVKMKVEVEGIASVLSGVTGDSLKGNVNVEEYFANAGVQTYNGNYLIADGVYRMEIYFTLPDGVTQSDSCYAEVKITAE